MYDLSSLDPVVACNFWGTKRYHWLTPHLWSIPFNQQIKVLSRLGIFRASLDKNYLRNGPNFVTYKVAEPSVFVDWHTMDLCYVLSKLSKKLQGLDALGRKHFAFLIIGKYLAGIPASKNSTQENHSVWNLGIRKQFDCVLWYRYQHCKTKVSLGSQIVFLCSSKLKTHESSWVEQSLN